MSPRACTDRPCQHTCHCPAVNTLPNAHSPAVQIYRINATLASGLNGTFLCASINGSAVNGLVPTVEGIFVVDVDDTSYVDNVERLIHVFSPIDASVFYNRCVDRRGCRPVRCMTSQQQ